jgi:hypothetical protein
MWEPSGRKNVRLGVTFFEFAQERLLSMVVIGIAVPRLRNHLSLATALSFLTNFLLFVIPSEAEGSEILFLGIGGW